MEDIAQFGVSDEGKDIINYLIDQNWFNSQQTAIKFAISVAISIPLDTSQNKSQFKTSQHVGGLDKDGNLAKLVREIYPDELPYKFAQVLCDEGLKYIYDKILKEHVTLDSFTK